MSTGFTDIPALASPRWKAPVADASALPMIGNTDGDTRVTLNDKSIYVWNAGSSTWLQAATPSVSSSITALTGDVTAMGPGAVGATVNAVGGETAANVAAGSVLANAATDANTASAIVKRDASGNFAAGTISVEARMGVGNATPAFPVDIVGGGQTSGLGNVELSIASSDTECGILLHNTGVQGRKWSILSTGGGSAFGNGNFVIGDATGSGTYLTLTHGGSAGIGIGLLTPAYNLDVVGTGHFSGALMAASMVPANGASGSFTSNDGKTITVTNGIITAIV